jgi:hypothetical protein
LSGYQEVFRKLGKEGFKGLYKGNLTGVIMASSNAWVKNYLYKTLGETGYLSENSYSHLISTFLVY